MTLCVLATGNRHKLAELAALLEAAGVALEVVSPKRFGVPPEIEETGTSYGANAVLKATGVAQWLAERGCPGDALVLADDSGLCVDVLGGAPGVRSARFGGDPSDDANNNARLVAELRARGVTCGAAHYACVLALVQVEGGAPAGQGGSAVCFEGRWDVEVRVDARGSGGFGYDPHAWIDGGARTVAELGASDKAARSHRGHALRALLAWWAAQRA